MDKAFHYQRRVNFSETDMAGVMHFASYLEVMEEVEHAMWRSLGESVNNIVDGELFLWPRVSVSCDYIKPLRFEDEIDLRLVVQKLGEKSMTYSVGFYVNDSKAAEASATAVCCRESESGFRSTQIPDRIREKLSSLLVASE